MVGPDRDQDPAPDALPPALADIGAWANYRFYLAQTWGPGVDPPHWSSILIDDDRLQNSYWTIANIHRFMQFSGGQAQAVQYLNGVKASVKKQDLTERAMKAWQPVRLNGIVTNADYTPGDFGLDHTTGYRDGEDAPYGGVADESDPAEFAGLDWDMGVRPDPAFNYLVSKARSSVGVEIEHFAIALGGGDPHASRYKTYYPKAGEWLQAVGRWVTDNGHPQDDDYVNGFYTEIHPAEMLTSTRYIDQTTTEVRVVVTGAWLGSTLKFVVNPPPRPSANARLRWDIFRADGTKGFDRKDKSDLQLVGRGGAEPAYLLATIRSTAPASILQYEMGMVGMDGSRGLQCIIRVWWEDKVSGASGQLRTASGGARGAHLFYRDGASPTAPWVMLPVDSNGRYSLGTLRAGARSWLRPGGSGWNFTGVPELWTAPATPVTKDFTATRTTEAVTRALRRIAGRTARSSSGVPAAAAAGARQPMRVTPGRSGRPEQGGPLQAVRGLLVSFKEPSGNFGVAQNGLGYPESGTVYIQLRGMVGFDNQPVQSLGAACTAESDGSLALQGLAGAGVANARVRARLLLGNPVVGYRTAQEAIAQTDAEGFAAFRLTAGSPVEDAVIEYAILENPFNPWFTPTFDGRDWTFYPATTRGDVSGAEYGLVPVGDIAASVAAKGFVREARERVERTAVIRKAGPGPSLRLKGRALLPGLKKLATVDKQ